MNDIDRQRLIESLQGLGDVAFVMKAYLTLLGRTPDPDGAASYGTRLRAGVPRIQVWTEIEEGKEARDFAIRHSLARGTGPQPAVARSVDTLLMFDGAEFVRQAYRAVLGREADTAGLRDYSTRLAAGASKRQLLADLRCDPEGRVRAAAVVGLDDLVREVQARGGTSDTGLLSLDDIQALHGEALVRAAYLVLFKREPDAQGLARYSDLLRSGFSALHVLKTLYRAPEAREKGAALPGLAEAISCYDKAQTRSWRGWYYRAVMGYPSDLPGERQLRALAYRLLESKG